MIDTVPETGSTNADLVARLRAGERLDEGYWLVADRQTAGRGRLGREWHDGAGNFMGSTVVWLRAGDPPAASLSFVAALAVFATIAPLFDASHRLELKWPNDVLFNGGKVAGLLLERVGEAVVIGVGVNLASAPELPDRPTSALAAHGPAPTRDDFAAALAENLAHGIGRWREFGLHPVLAGFLAHSIHRIGLRTVVHDGSGDPVVGAFAGLEDNDGALCLRLDDGSERIIHAGEVVLAGD